MAKADRTNGQESGTGQDTPKVCVRVPLGFLLHQAGHGGTLSRPVPLSRRRSLKGQPHPLDRPSLMAPPCSCLGTWRRHERPPL
jgi:hypothetical protein